MTDRPEFKGGGLDNTCKPAKLRTTPNSNRTLVLAFFLLLVMNAITLFQLISTKDELGKTKADLSHRIDGNVSSLDFRTAETRDLLDDLLKKLNSSNTDASFAENTLEAQVQLESYLATTKIDEAREKLEKLIKGLDSKTADNSVEQDRKIAEITRNTEDLKLVIKRLEDTVSKLEKSNNEDMKGIKKEVDTDTAKLVKRVDKLYELYENVSLRIVQQFNKADRTERDIPNILAKLNKLKIDIDIELDRAVNKLSRQIQNLDTRITAKVLALENKVRALERK